MTTQPDFEELLELSKENNVRYFLRIRFSNLRVASAGSG